MTTPDYKLLLRELIMREGLAFPETEQDKVWYAEQNKPKLLDKFREAVGLEVTSKTT